MSRRAVHAGSPLLWLGLLLAGCATPSCSKSDRIVPARPEARHDTTVKMTGERLMQIFDDARKGGRDEVAYVEPNATELDAFRVWVRDALVELEAGRAPERAVAGFVLDRDGDVVIVHEAVGARRGAGAFAFRVGTASALAIGAPHTFHDSGTLPIAVTAFDIARARALSINTVHRYSDRIRAGGSGTLADDDKSPARSDVAHQERSFFQVVHEELTRRHVTTVQLHGFRDDLVPGTDAVMSSAGTTFDVQAHALKAKTSAGGAIASFPRDTKKLGALTNVQARFSVRERAPFLHIEMSKTLRDELVRDPARRVEFLRSALPNAP